MRVYIIFYKADPQGGTNLFVPIKRKGYDYAGMPQFFGGEKNPKETEFEALARETKEESDAKIGFTKDDKKLVHKKTIDSVELKFYMSSTFIGNKFIGPLKGGEMASIESVYVPEKDRDYDIDDMLKKLGIAPSERFVKSETYEAFVKVLAALTK